MIQHYLHSKSLQFSKVALITSFLQSQVAAIFVDDCYDQLSGSYRSHKLAIKDMSSIIVDLKVSNLELVSKKGHVSDIPFSSKTITSYFRKWIFHVPFNSRSQQQLDFIQLCIMIHVESSQTSFYFRLGSYFATILCK